MDDPILLIEDDPAWAEAIRAALPASGDAAFEVKWVRRLADGLERLRTEAVGVVIVDLFLPDSEGVETLDALFGAAPHVPILILSGADEEDTARRAVQRGAQDYLLKTHVDRHVLPRALRYAIERKTAEEALYVEKELAQVTLNSIGDAVLSTDVAGNVTYLNRAAERMIGWSRQEALGRPLTDVFRIIDGATREPLRNPLALAVKQTEAVGLAANCILIRRDGLEIAIEDSTAPIRDTHGRIAGAVIVFHDVSEARAMTLKMSHLAQHDYLTDLPNRMLLNDRLTQAIRMAQRRGHQAAVLFLDLDRFKRINDSLGHAIGDELLQSVAKRLAAGVRRSDTVSRQGGDEFVILFPAVSGMQDVAASAKKMLIEIAAPYRIGAHNLHVTASIGISLYPDHGVDAESLVKHADIAMYHAKDCGRNNFQFFKQDMNTRAVERQSLEASLRDALERQEFVLHYQPKVNLETGTIAGAEALVRWQHRERGLIFPAQFVAIAEDCGLIVPIGRWVLQEACRQARAWLDAGHPVPVAVNVSAVEFRDKDFLESVRLVLQETALAPRYLELELTESVLMRDAESAATVLRALKSMGVGLAIDDFGTGYSSLSYLRQFPIDALKIDQSFVRDITTDPRDVPIVSAVISMGRSLQRRVIAEGVETREQLISLQAQRCAEGQGFYLGRPLIAAEFAALLKTGRRRNYPESMLARPGDGDKTGGTRRR